MRFVELSGREAGVATFGRFSRPLRFSPWMRAYAYVAVVFFSNALDRPLAGNPSSYVGNSQSSAIQVVGSLLILVAGLITGRNLIVRRKTQPFNVTTIGLILGLLCVWVLLSIGWSADPAISFRRGVAFVGTVLVGWTFAAYVPRDEMLRVLATAAIALIFISAVLAIINPGYAFHQAGELGNPEHVGRMRGSYAHKNEFARAIALATFLAIVPGLTVFRNKWPVIAAVAAGVVLMVLAGSAKVMVALPVALAAAGGLKFCRTLLQRIALLFFVGLPGLLLAWSGVLDRLMADVFSDLGRDPTMSGRDVIWAAAVHSISDHLLVGQGYAAGWAAQAKHEMQMLTGQLDVMEHAHNGYLQTMLDLGAVGLLLALAPVAYILWDVLSARPRRNPVLESLSIAFAVYFVVTNVTGSYLTNYNDFFTVLLVCLALWISQDRRSYRLDLKRRQRAQMAERLAAGPAEASTSIPSARQTAL